MIFKDYLIFCYRQFLLNRAANVWFIDGHAKGHKKGSLKKLGINSGWTEGNAQVSY